MSKLSLELPLFRGGGRHIHHDPRSLRYVVPPTSNVSSVSWDARIPILDQGSVGSCTGNAMTGVMGTSPFFETLPEKTQSALDERYALEVYALATQLDPFPGTYPGQDTGSDGLSAAKALVKLGDANGEVHGTSIGSLHAMIQTSAFAVGLSWRTGCDSPDRNGLVKYAGAVRGGHEVCFVAYDSATNTWKVRNSWGPSWGKDGFFFITDDDVVKLLADQGDATQPTPITAPAPTPTPAPVVASSFAFTAGDVAALNSWADAPHVWRKATAAAKAWHAKTVS